ncbi:hypothetical protein CNMCM7691_004260 [Aspergillus felis]|uniref:LysM domain-containing protein n=1 Tax=Aspergillus felis TaxID=1287682 RepID=A0A8H6V9C9_9EURO|nr:hypothetical protein CNMCM7691_004260 [Aspergillus felis]
MSVTVHFSTSKASVLLLLLLALGREIGALQLFNSTPSGLPSACGEALTANVTCDQLLSAPLISNQQYVDNVTLAAVCTTACSDSLLSFKDDVESACGATEYTFRAASIKPGGDYCYSAINNPNNTVQACSDCFLQYEAAMLGSSYGLVRVDPGSFSSLLSSCGMPASSYPYTVPTSTVATPTSSTTVTATSTCTGTSYTVQEGDSCDSIALANSIATDRFITENGLDLNCSTLKVGNEVCLGASCALYQVQPNDTCDSILANHTFYLTQLLSWNPTIHTTCDNLDTFVGKDICVSPPGSTEWDVTPTTFTTTWNVTFVLQTTLFTSIPSQTAAPNYTTSWFVSTTTIANHTVTGTASASDVVSAYNDLLVYCPITYDDTMSGWSPYDLPDDCLDGLLEYCSPSINATMPASTSFPASCSPAYWDAQVTASSTAPLTPSTSSVSVPEQTGIPTNCDAYYVVQANDTCAGIVSAFGNFTLTQFYSWNPAVGSSCFNLLIGYAVCIGVSGGPSATPTTTSTASSSIPSPLMPSTVADCTEYYYVVSGDTCASIEAAYGITAAQFAEWNPYIGSGCTNLWLDTYICVAAPDSSSSTPTTTQSATTTVPSPTMPSTDPNCTKYYYVVSGDTCAGIEAANGITATEFDTWNPYIGSDCSNLWLNYYVCVAASS